MTWSWEENRQLVYFKRHTPHTRYTYAMKNKLPLSFSLMLVDGGIKCTMKGITQKNYSKGRGGIVVREVVNWIVMRL